MASDSSNPWDDVPEPDLAHIVSAEPLLVALDQADILLDIAERRTMEADDPAVARARAIHASVTLHLEDSSLRQDSLALVRRRVEHLAERLSHLTDGAG